MCNKGCIGIGCIGVGCIGVGYIGMCGWWLFIYMDVGMMC